MAKLKLLSERLKKCGYMPEIFESGDLAAQRIHEIVKCKTVGMGSSMTLEKLGIQDSIKDLAKEIYPHSPGQGGDDERKALTADYYLCSANAISISVYLINEYIGL